MTQWMDHPFAAALASALLHFIWQGAILALVALAAWRLVRSSPARYLIGVITLAAMLAAPLVTLGYVAAAARGPAASERALAADRIPRFDGMQPERPAPAPSEAGRIAPPRDGGTDTADRYAWLLRLTSGPSWILLIWLPGVLVLSGRLLGGWLVARRFTRHGVAPLAPEISALASRVAGRLSLQRPVRIVGSSGLSAPMMVGWLKPIVLFPASALTALTPEQVEALLAHELAHVRRHDYAVNLLQSIVETLLFYHPAVWWISRQVRTERERCCDDLAVTVCDRVTYVTALADLAALGAGPRVALAATDGSLLDRVRRLLGQPHASHPAGGAWLPAMLIALAATALLPGALAAPLGQNVRSGVGGGVPDGIPGGSAGGITAGVNGGLTTRPATDHEDGTGNDHDDVPTAGMSGGATQEETGRQTEPSATRTGEQARTNRSAESDALRAAREELARLLAQEQAIAAKYLQQKSEMEQRRRHLDLRTAEAELDAALTQRELELRDLRRQLERVRAQVEVGLAEPLEQERLESELRLAESRLQGAQAERETRLKQAMLDMEIAQQLLEFEQRQLEIEHARRRLELEHGLAFEHGTGASRDADIDRTVLADQAQPIVSGDVLAIEVAGEPSLPRAYPVADDGTITLPLLGSLPAAGRTADQVRGDIRRLLTERGLKPDPTVVVVRRTPQR